MSTLDPRQGQQALWTGLDGKTYTVFSSDIDLVADSPNKSGARFLIFTGGTQLVITTAAGQERTFPASLWDGKPIPCGASTIHSETDADAVGVIW